MTKQTLVPTIQQMTSFGTAEPFVARISLGLCDLLRGLDINELDKQIAQEHILETFQEFCNAFLSLREIVEMESGSKQLLLTNKRKAYQDLYSYCWRGYKDRMPNIPKALKIDIGFLFREEEQFNNGVKEFAKNYPKIGHEFIKMVKADRSTWQNTIMKVRNDYIEHYKSEISEDEINYYFSPKTAMLVFENCWQAVEDIVVMCFTERLLPGIKIGLISKEDIDEICPKKYCFTQLKHDK